MSAPASPFTLAEWRRSVALEYAAVRSGVADAEGAAKRFRAARDRLFRDHPESPIAPDARREWRGVDWYAYAPAWRLKGLLELATKRDTFEVSLAADGILRCTRVGHVRFVVGGRQARLAIYWLEGYGGGIWLPFADTTSGADTYGGGRYLYDTIKGADLGVGERELVLDFNYAYNPSCAYDERWSCPLSPSENRLPFAVSAGERQPKKAT
ncbi:MAG: DUF1684 domain-containing protein [Betaproteobacteria bacterium]